MHLTDIITLHLDKDNNNNSLKMGYFSQRKKQARENIFMVASIVVTAIIYSILWFDCEDSYFVSFLRGWQFHLYVFNILLLIYTLWHRKLAYSLLVAFLLLLNFGSLAKTARLFFNDTSDSTKAFNVLYKKGPQDYENIFSPEDVLLRRQGKLQLSPNISASFMSFEKFDQVFTVINIDFSHIDIPEQKVVFNNLARFVDNQDDPVVIVGDFGIPSWSPIFREFLIKTDLDVKNRILYTDGKRYFAPFIIPTINVLGFDNIGIRRLKFIPEDQNFDIKLAF